MSNALPRRSARRAAAPRRSGRVGGGKGGIGKSLLTAALGWQLARMGKRVVLVDADLGGANLHTCLGVPAAAALRWATSSSGAWSASRTWWWRRTTRACASSAARPTC